MATTTNVVGQKIAKTKKRSRPEYDFYATPVADVERMLRTVFGEFIDEQRFCPTVLDPCAGNGAFKRAIHNVVPHWSVKQWDIVEREEPLNWVGDFLSMSEKEKGHLYNTFSIVMMNPPYTQATEFIEHGLKFLRQGGVLIAFLKLDFLATKKRFDRLYKGRCRLSDVYINVSRVHCKYNGDLSDKENSTTESGWFLFTNDDLPHPPQLHWIPKDD